MTESATPHRPAAFINAIADEGTKDEAIRYLQQTWNELCAAKDENIELRAKLEAAETIAHRAEHRANQAESERDRNAERAEAAESSLRERDEDAGIAKLWEPLRNLWELYR